LSDPARELRRNLAVVLLSFFALWAFMFAMLIGGLGSLDHARFEVVNRSGCTIDALLISDDMPGHFKATPAQVTQLANGSSVTITTVANDTSCPRLELAVDGTKRTFSMPGMTQWGDYSIAILDGGGAIDFASRGLPGDRIGPDGLASAPPPSSR
jgi:hypothetical protein